jgi:glycogen(starch) synthase
MNILMLGWELPPHNSGGLGVACLQMSKALAMQGASIDFVVPYEAEHPDVTFMNIVPAIPKAPSSQYGLNAYDTHFIDKNHPNEGMRAIQQQYLKAVERLVESSDTDYDAIHAHDWLTMEAGMRAKELSNKPLIVHVHATEFDRAGDRYGNPLIHEVEEQGLLMADRIIAVSNITKQLIVSRYNIPAEKVEVMHNALDVEALLGYEYDMRTYQYLEHLKGQGYTVVANIARFTVQKGLHQFLAAAARACERYDKIVFLLAGDGEQRDELIRLSAELGIADKVFFTGFIRGKQWRDAFSVADVFVMSSVSEPFGITALEAAHHDDAVIVTKQSGVGEVLRNVYRYDFWDVDALADRLVAVASSAALRDTLRENIAYEYSRITWHDVARRCLELYQALNTREVAA